MNFISGEFLPNTKRFQPNKLPITLEWDDKVIDKLLLESMRLLGELNAYSKLIPDVDFFIRMHITKEATVSSRIEGTRTELYEVLLPEEEISPEGKDDWQEIQNYIRAMNSAINQLEQLPISTRLIKDTHKILLDNARGENKSPGDFRQLQNWIGGPTEDTALFIPPAASQVEPLISDLETFWHRAEDEIPVLVKIALGHYQFETIHPFLDGNGRIGRLLITLQLVESKILQKPTLYLSEYFERNKGDYYDALTLVRESGDVEHWIRFFLQGVITTAQNSRETFEKIVELREKYNKQILTLGSRARKAQVLINHMYSHPIVNNDSVKRLLGVSFSTANNLVEQLTAREILREVTGFSRNRLFILDDYVNLFRR